MATATAPKPRVRGRNPRKRLTAEDVGDILGLYEAGVLLGVDDRTPHTWKYRDQLPPPDYDSINGLPAWDRTTIVAWAARTERLPESLISEAGNRKVKARITQLAEIGFGPNGETPGSTPTTKAKAPAKAKAKAK